jgi:sigma-E factor negative regulatory protein RseB
VTGSRTVLVGSALPLLILVGLLRLPSAQSALGLERQPSPTGRGTPSSATAAATSSISAASSSALVVLRRSIRAERALAFSGTQIVTVWSSAGSTTEVLDLVQRPGGQRMVKIRDTGDGASTGDGAARVIGQPVADGAGSAALSERALDALAEAYQLRIAASDQVVGRSATVVVAERNGREAARIWLDDATGLVLRQEVLDRAGRLARMVAFLDLRLAARGAGAGQSSNLAANPLPGLAVKGQTAPWSDVISASALDGWRAAGWPCPQRLPSGFVLLDARRASTSSSAPMLHLTYSDGLSAISVFLQRGKLNDGQLKGLRSEKWGNAVVHVRAGWPELMVWQGGPTVITAVGDAEPAELRAALDPLPRQPDRGALDSLQHAMGSALAWFRG